MANVLKDYLGNIINCIIPRYEKLKYNLITDGPAIKTGRKIDGKQEFVKRINFKKLPNASQKNIDLGLKLNRIKVVDVKAFPRTITGDINPLPFVSISTLGNQISYYFRTNQDELKGDLFVIDTGVLDRSMYSLEVDIYFICIDDNYDPNE